MAFLSKRDGADEIFVISAGGQGLERVTNEGISIPVGLTL